jgi:hypothetical protein
MLDIDRDEQPGWSSFVAERDPLTTARLVGQRLGIEVPAVRLGKGLAVAFGGPKVVLVDRDQRGRGDRRGRNNGAKPRRQPTRGQPAGERPARRSPEADRVSDARLEARRRLLCRRQHQQLVADLREPLHGVSAVRACRQVAQRLGALLAVGDSERDLGSEVAGLRHTSFRPLQ